MPSNSEQRESRTRLREKIPPAFNWRHEEFLKLHDLQADLEKRKKTLMFSREEVEAYKFEFGSPLNIDEEDPLNLDPTYFTPCPADVATEAIAHYMSPNKPYTYQTGRWPKKEPLEIPRKSPEGAKYWDNTLVHYSMDRSREADAHAYFITGAAKPLYRDEWTSHRFLKARQTPGGQMWMKQPGGQEKFMHYFGTYQVEICRSSSPGPGPDPTKPHCIGIITDNARPKSNHILRSELLLIARLLKTQVRCVEAWPGHGIFPVLVLSFHARYSARIIQAYLKDGKMVLRVSRLLNLHSNKLPEDARILVQWARSVPVGDTALSSPEAPALDEGSDEQPADSDTHPPHGIASQA